MLTYIETSKIFSHPDNPRKDLGDLAELSDSIKARGILQNLTVIPRIGNTTNKGNEGTYTVIIGHRRLAAARLAGLTEVPCIVSDMTPREQVATMLLENMQRSDLTTYEQAQGFQMMLDLGETVGGISKQTGFSDNTIRRRVKLLELDKDKFAQSIERGATFADYESLSKINDIKLRNKVLEKIGTENFAWELKTALSNETRAENKAVIVEALEKFATKIKDSDTSKYQYGRYVSLDKSDFDVPDDAGSEKYFYTESSHCITLYKECQKQEKQKKTPEEVNRERKLKELNTLFKQAYELRLSFAKEFKAIGKVANAVDKKAIEVLFASSSRPDNDVFRALFGIKEKFRMSWEDKQKGETYEEALSRIMVVKANTHNTTLLFWGVYCNLETPGATCLSWGGPVFSANEKLEALYDYLTGLGYAMSDEEKALMDGSHELYDASKADDEDEDDGYDQEEDPDDEDEADGE